MASLSLKQIRKTCDGGADPLAAGSRVALRPDLARSRLFDSAGDAFQQSA
jgi:hypothetical protein